MSTKHSRELSCEGSSIMDSKRNKKVKESAPAKDGEVSKSPSLSGFLGLPQEIKTIIIELCITPPDPRHGKPNFDMSSVTGILRSCRSLYELVSSLVYPLLFDHVLLLRSSQLVSFHHALTTKAWLRPLVKTMWIGHHSLWNLKWPAGLEDGSNESKRQYWIEDGLRPRESSLAPKWVYPGHRWSSNKRGVGSCRDRFVFKAVDAAQEGLGIDLRSPPRSAWAERGGWEKTEMYIINTFRVQACLDLYLMEMRRVEDERGYPTPSYYSLHRDPDPDSDCALGTCGHYPQLTVAGGKSSAAASCSSLSSFIFTVTLAEMDAHLARPGCQTDCFDHPLLFARSRRRQFCFDKRGKTQGSGNGPWLVPLKDAGALAFDAATYNGNIGMIRSILVMAQGAHIRLWAYPIQESVERGWDRRLVAARKEDEGRPDTDMLLERRLVAEDEEPDEGESMEKEEKKGKVKRRSSERSSRVLTRGRLSELGEWYSHADLDSWGYS